jgi:hypothetical protein
MPPMCACCTGVATTKLKTAPTHTTTRRVAWFEFPYCAPCAAHVRWSGAGPQPLRLLGFVVAGIIAVVLVPHLTHDKQGPENAVLGGIFLVAGIAGYVGTMILLAILGSSIAGTHAGCGGRDLAVQAHAGTGGFKFRFTNAQFDQVFRTVNHGYEPIDAAEVLRKMNQRS